MLTQSEADALIKMSKKRFSDDQYTFPSPGEKLALPLVSENGREQFKLYIYRGKIRLTKCNYTELGRDIVVLVRLDVGGSPHSNPDGPAPLPFLEPYASQEMECPHLHLYVEGYAARWAIPAPVDIFTAPKDLGRTMDEFFSYCNVIEPPIVQRTLF